MKTIATIEARMTSSRLPGKVLLPALGKPMLEHLVNRLERVPSLDAIVLATTVNAQDNVLIETAKRLGISFYRGSELDVMERVVGAGDSVAADLLVEITADCPLIDPNIIERHIQIFQKNQYDYVSNVEVRSYPIGMDTQVYRLDTLKKSFRMTQDRLDHEHVTRHIRQNPQLFKQHHVVAEPKDTWPELALTLDEPKDYELIKRVLEHFGRNDFSCSEIISLLRDEHPDWSLINQEVRRKGLNA